jgi:5'-methylthioadenosine phosphorylase
MKLGIIGGSGLYNLGNLEHIEHREVPTPFGRPSDEFVCGTLQGRELVFLPRHGRAHRLLPSEINHRANIYGFKVLGVERVVSISAVGSLREQIRPRDVVLPDQYFDRTRHGPDHTFFGNGIVAHVPFGEPTCPDLRRGLAAAVGTVLRRRPGQPAVQVFESGTYVNMEGPAFSTKAESKVYRTLGFDVIGMTSLPEAKLCREAELCYQAVAMVTDYDCWHETEAPVTVEMIVGHLNANVQLAREIVAEAALQLPAHRHCGCGAALASAIITSREAIPESARAVLRPIAGRYLEQNPV